MIDIRTETMLTVSKAARFYSERFGGKTSPSTIYRWTAKGHNGVRLDYLETPRGRRTSIEALDRFLAALTSVESGQRVLSRSEEIAERQALERLRARGIAQ